MANRIRQGIWALCFVGLTSQPASALCMEVLERPETLGPMVSFGYEAPPLAHFLQSGLRGEPSIFDGTSLRTRELRAPDGRRRPPAGGYNGKFPAPETDEGEVFALLRQSGDGSASSELSLFRLDDATREFEPQMFRGPTDLDVTDAIWSALFGGTLLVAARDGIYDLSRRNGVLELSPLSTEGGIGVRTFTDLPTLDAVFVAKRPPSEELPSRQPVLSYIFDAGGVMPVELPVSKSGWLRTRKLQPRGFWALNEPPGLLVAEVGDGGTESYRFVALARQDGEVTVRDSAVTEGHDHRIAILGGAGFTLGGRAAAEIAFDDIQIFDGATLRPLHAGEQGVLPDDIPLYPAFGIGFPADQVPGAIVGLTGDGRFFTYDPAAGFVETEPAPQSGPQRLEGQLWYAPSTALSIDKLANRARVIGPGGGAEEFPLSGNAIVQIVPRYGEILILDDMNLRVATAGPCGP